MNAKELLEKDKQKLVERLQAAAGEPETALRVMEEELNHIWLTLSQEEPRSQETVRNMLETAKAALPLADSSGEIKAYWKTSLSAAQNQKDRVRRLLPGACLGAVLACAVFSALFRGGLGFVLGLAAALSGAAAAFLTGRRTKAGVGTFPPQNPEDLIFEIPWDPEKLYHHLHVLLSVIDETHIQAGEEVEKTEQVLALSGLEDPLPDEEIRLYSSLFESAYAMPQEAYAKDIISSLRYFLHRKGIETVDFCLDRKNWFDLLPGGETQTLRPALIRGEEILCKGLATM